MDFPHGTGHPASPSSPVIGLSLHGCQDSLSSLSEIWALLSLSSHILSSSSDSVLVLLLVICLAVVVERLVPGGVLQTLGSPRDPDSTGSSAGSKSVERCEGIVTVAQEADAERF